MLSEKRVGLEYAGTMVTDYILQFFDEFPTRSSVKKAIKRGEILVDGNKVDTAYKVTDEQLVTYIEITSDKPKSTKLKLEIIFEDDYIAVINKPAGFEVSGNKFNSIQNALASNIKLSASADALKIPRPVHRLDYPTSGLLIIAKTRSALSNLGNQFEQRTVQKRYRALVSGKLEPEGTINKSVDGLQAKTYFKVTRYHRSLKTDWISEVDLFPHTGRKHQLRVHMSEHGFPIVGDQQYGDGPVLKGKGLFLSAVEICFIHPVTEETTQFIIEPPAKFKSFVERQNKNWDKYHNNI